MTHVPVEAVPEHRLPSAQSQGFASVRVVPFSDPYSTGPLTVRQTFSAPTLAALAHLPGSPLVRCRDSEPAAG